MIIIGVGFPIRKSEFHPPWQMPGVPISSNKDDEILRPQNPCFSLCGLDGCLCPRFHIDGFSRHPGCGGPGFSDKHPACAIVTCNGKHEGAEYRFECPA